MKTFVKLVLTCLALWLFSLGWIDIVWKPLVADQILNQILGLFILSLIIGLGMFIMTTFYMAFIFVPFRTGISLLLIFLAGTGFFLFWFIQQALPGWIFINVGFWGTLLMSFVLGMIWFSNNKSDY